MLIVCICVLAFEGNYNSFANLMETQLSQSLTIRKMKSIHSTLYDKDNKLYVLNVSFQGEAHQEAIFLPEWILEPPDMESIKEEIGHKTVEVDIDESSLSLEISKSKDMSSANQIKLPKTALEELREKAMEIGLSIQKKEEEEEESKCLV